MPQFGRERIMSSCEIQTEYLGYKNCYPDVSNSKIKGARGMYDCSSAPGIQTVTSYKYLEEINTQLHSDKISALLEDYIEAYDIYKDFIGKSISTNLGDPSSFFPKKCFAMNNYPKDYLDASLKKKHRLAKN